MIKFTADFSRLASVQNMTNWYNKITSIYVKK